MAMASSASPSAPHQIIFPPSPSPLPPPHPLLTQLHTRKIHPYLNPPLIAMLAVLSAALLIILYTRFLTRLFRLLPLHATRHVASTEDPTSPPSFTHSDFFFSPFYGLDEITIKSLPLSKHTRSNSTPNRECPICLVEFHQDDLLRTIPMCSHSFHVDCIDTWLRSHATCPLCRSYVMFVPMRAARIQPNLDPQPDFFAPDPEIQAATSPPPQERNYLLKRSYSFGHERNLGSDSPWRYRQRHGSFWSKRWPSPFSMSATSSRNSRLAIKSPFAKRRMSWLPLTDVRVGPGTSRRSRAMTSPSAIFMRSMGGGLGSSRLRCGDPEALLSPDRLRSGR